MGCLHLNQIDKARYVLAAALLLLTGVPSAKASEIGTRYLFLDARGDITLATDGRGNAVQSSRYGPWGNLIRKSGKGGARPGFTGQELDSATGLHYFNARYYDANLGRFLSPDPLRQFRSTYLYAFNSPLEYVDPTGKGGKFRYGGRPLEDAALEYRPKLLLGGHVRDKYRRRTLDGNQRYRAAYYYEASVVNDAVDQPLVYSPTKLSSNQNYKTQRIQNVRRAVDSTPLGPDDFIVQDYHTWIDKQADGSVVIVYLDHGGGSTLPRIMDFEDKIRPFAKKFFVCIDVGCKMTKVDSESGRMLSQMYNDEGLPYFSSSTNVHMQSLHDITLLSFSGKKYRIGSSHPPFEKGDWDTSGRHEIGLLAPQFVIPDDGMWDISLPQNGRKWITKDFAGLNDRFDFSM